MLRIGLTGGIGSGKTTVADHFSRLGITVIDADEIVRHVSSPGHHPFDAIIHHFGNEILNTDGTINRQKLGQRVFNNAAERQVLEAILHPAVRSVMQKAVQQAPPSPYCILVIPLLVETGYVDLVDRVIVVTADRKNRIDWVKKRDGLTDDQIESIMAAQASDNERRKIADDVIENNGTLDSLFRQVEKLDLKYREI
jgi:dephospho-CoA kinase